MGDHIFGTFGHDFACKDGRRVMIVGVSPNQWNAIINVTNTKPQIISLEEELELDFSKEGDRFIARERLKDLFAPWFADKLYLEVKQGLNMAGVCWGPYQSIEELISNDVDCTEANPLFTRIEQPGIGTYLVPSQAIQFTGLESEPPKPAPLLGQHTDEILTEVLGMSSGQISKLHDENIIAGPQ